MTSLTIVGCGMAGLLAANMLHHRTPTIIEQQASLPHNHSAVLRFRSSTVGDVLNIPFKKVSMIKSALHWQNPIADALAYSFKNTGSYRSDRSVTQGYKAEERYIAPNNLIELMAARVTISFEKAFALAGSTGDLISTIPMPALMTMLNYDKPPVFSYVHGCNVNATIPKCDAYVSLLVPDPDLPFSRISLMGDQMIVECPGAPASALEAYYNLAFQAVELLGIRSEPKEIAVVEQTYAKILPIDDDARKTFIHWASQNYCIYSLGRYATWRPSLQLDDLVQDVRLIDRWMSQNNKYDMSRRM